MKTAICTYKNGTIIRTSINGSNAEINDYFLNRYINIGSFGFDDLQKCIKVEIIENNKTKGN